MTTKESVMCCIFMKSSLYTLKDTSSQKKTYLHILYSLNRILYIAFSNVLKCTNIQIKQFNFLIHVQCIFTQGYFLRVHKLQNGVFFHSTNRFKTLLYSFLDKIYLNDSKKVLLSTATRRIQDSHIGSSDCDMYILFE